MMTMIITLEQTLVEQKNLSQLCSDAPPKQLNTNEIFTPNAFYGNDMIYKRYAGLPVHYPLKAVLPHGPEVAYTLEMLWDNEMRNSLPEIWCYSNLSIQKYSQALRNFKIEKKVVPSASPFLYLTKLIKTNSIPPKREGTIFFPSHSTHHITDNSDFELLASKLDCLGEEYRPITVCVYWRDFNLGHHLPFEKRGMKIASSGHIYDPNFLFRFYHLCSLHKYSCSHNHGTAIFYSIKAGCSYFHLDAEEVYSSSLRQIKNPDISLANDPAKFIFTEVTSLNDKINQARIFRDLFAVPKQELTSEQIDFVDEILGYQFLKTPTELQNVIIAAEAKYVANAEIAFQSQRQNLPRRIFSKLSHFFKH